MDEELVSIIVPIYNMEKYLKRCIESILNQTYKHIEILLINDGSTDYSEKICMQYNDERIHYFYKENGGLSDARNYGIDRSKGDYVCFVDSDDCIHSRFVEILYRTAKVAKTSIAMCLFTQFFDNNIPEDAIYQELPSWHSASSGELGKLFSSNYYPNITIAWNKIYKSDLFKKVRFPAGKLHEDEATTYKLLSLANNFAILDEGLYYYFSNINGITKSKFKTERLVFIDVLLERFKFAVRQKNYAFARTTCKQLYNYYVDLLTKDKDFFKNYDEAMALLKEYFPRIKRILLSKYSRIDIKIVLYLSFSYSSILMKMHFYVIKFLLKIIKRKK